MVDRRGVDPNRAELHVYASEDARTHLEMEQKRLQDLIAAEEQRIGHIQADPKGFYEKAAERQNHMLEATAEAIQSFADNLIVATNENIKEYQAELDAIEAQLAADSNPDMDPHS